MNKLKILSILFSILILTLLVAGCFGGNKATGGGWFYDDTTGNYVTIGFNGQYVGEPYLVEDLLPGSEGPEDALVRDAKGQFQLTDHTLGVYIHGTFTTASSDLSVTDNSVFMGTCSVNEVGSYMFVVMFDDEYVLTEPPFTIFEDVNYISMFVDIDGNGGPDTETDIIYQGLLGGGSIRIHAN